MRNYIEINKFWNESNPCATLYLLLCKLKNLNLLAIWDCFFAHNGDHFIVGLPVSHQRALPAKRKRGRWSAIGQIIGRLGALAAAILRIDIDRAAGPRANPFRNAVRLSLSRFRYWNCLLARLARVDDIIFGIVRRIGTRIELLTLFILMNNKIWYLYNRSDVIEFYFCNEVKNLSIQMSYLKMPTLL